MSVPYRIVLMVTLLLAAGFAMAPWWTLRQISTASFENDDKAWQRLVNVEDIRNYTGGFLHALFESKLQMDLQNDPAEALRSYFDGKGQVDFMAERLSRPEALRQLVCGEIFGDVAVPAEPRGCWALEGEIHWQSPLLVKVTFDHPQNHWQSSLRLLRTGMFSWQVDSIELPAQAILERLAVLANNEAV